MSPGPISPGERGARLARGWGSTGSPGAPPSGTLPSVFSSSAAMMHILTARSVLDNPLARRRRLDADRVRALAGVNRCGDLGARHVIELPVLADLAETTASRLRLPDGPGWRLGQALGHALEQGVRLWLCDVSAEAVPWIVRTAGEGLVHVVSLPGPATDDAGGGTVVIAVSPLALILALADGGDASRRYLRTVLAGVDTLRCSRHAVRALRRSGVGAVQHPHARRLLRNPVALAYLAVFIYSSLRAVPVAFVPGFHGRVWILWLIDMVTAVPYTWGIVEMVAGRAIRRRLLGLATTVITFIAPYVYFWIKGRGYPPTVVVVVAAMIVGSAGIEVVRWLRSTAIVQGLGAGA